MTSYRIFFLLIFVSFLSFATTQAETDSDPVYIYHCSRGNTTNGNTFESNLKTLFSSLSYNVPATTDFTTTESLHKTPQTLSLDFSCAGVMSLLSFVNNVSKMQLHNYPQNARWPSKL